MIYLLYTLHVIICIFLILVVLLQQGKGADLSVFGGGATQAAFGARGAATILHKLTVAAFIGFILTTLGIGFMTGGDTADSVMTGVEADQAVEETAVPAAATPTTESGAVAAPEPGAAAEGGAASTASDSEAGAEPVESPSPADTTAAEPAPSQGAPATEGGNEAPDGAE